MMLSVEEKKYYDRQLKLEGFGEAAQLKLKNARVLVIGAGGLGCPVLQYLVGAGVGFITITDHDVVSEHNLHRQILFTVDDIGKSKAIIAKEKLQKLNPHITINSSARKLEADNAINMISSYDVIIDGSDNFTTRYLVNDACVMANKPFISGSISTHTAQISVFNFEDGPTYRCLFPEPPAEGEIPTCAEAGVLGALAGIAGTMLANEAIKLITQTGKILKGELLTFDILQNSFHTFSFRLNPENKKINSIQQENIACTIVNKISVEELKKLIREGNPPAIIDIRESWEFEEFNIGGKNIPLYELTEKKSEIDITQPTVFVCGHGSRSEMALRIMENAPTMKSLEGGVEAWNK